CTLALWRRVRAALLVLRMKGADKYAKYHRKNERENKQSSHFLTLHHTAKTRRLSSLRIYSGSYIITLALC
ncbi:hypothetical protein ABTL06_19455, partial [Acinetobacter baumannii]